MDKVFKITLIKPVTKYNINKEDLDEEFTEQLHMYITPNDIINNKIAVVGEDTFYVRGDNGRINELNHFFSKYHVVEITDVSRDLLDNNELYNSINEKDMLQFGKLFDDFRILNTTKDDVLDKILNYGIDYIDSIDKEILGESGK